MSEIRPFVWLSCLLPELSPLKCQEWLIFVFSDYSKKSVTILAKHLRASERSYIPLLENTMDWVLSYH